MVMKASVVDNHTFTLDSRYKFNNSRILGLGSNGIVVKAFDTIRGKEVAIKRIRPYARDKAYAKLLLREIRCLSILGTHPNVCIIEKYKFYCSYLFVIGIRSFPSMR
jgi:serine/threonine protein kinase